MIKNLKIFVASVLMIAALLSCNSNETDTAEAGDALAEMPHRGGTNAGELMSMITNAIDSGQSILEYGHYAIELQKEFKNIMDTCSDMDYRFYIRRLATQISNDLLFSTIDDSLQRAYYADSIVVPYSQVTYHWYKGFLDEGLIFFSEAYKVEDSAVWVFPMEIYIPKDKEKDEFMFVEFPDGAVGGTYIFVLDDDMVTPLWTLGPDNPSVHVMEKSDEYSGNLAMVFPLDSIIPHLRGHEAIILSYLADDASGNKHRFTVFHMNEFLSQYDALKK